MEGVGRALPAAGPSAPKVNDFRKRPGPARARARPPPHSRASRAPRGPRAPRPGHSPPRRARPDAPGSSRLPLERLPARLGMAPPLLHELARAVDLAARRRQARVLLYFCAQRRDRREQLHRRPGQKAHARAAGCGNGCGPSQQAARQPCPAGRPLPLRERKPPAPSARAARRRPSPPRPPAPAPVPARAPHLASEAAREQTPREAQTRSPPAPRAGGGGVIRGRSRGPRRGADRGRAPGARRGGRADLWAQERETRRAAPVGQGDLSKLAELRGARRDAHDGECGAALKRDDRGERRRAERERDDWRAGVARAVAPRDERRAFRSPRSHEVPLRARRRRRRVSWPGCARAVARVGPARGFGENGILFNPHQAWILFGGWGRGGYRFLPRSVGELLLLKRLLRQRPLLPAARRGVSGRRARHGSAAKGRFSACRRLAVQLTPPVQRPRPRHRPR